MTSPEVPKNAPETQPDTTALVEAIQSNIHRNGDPATNISPRLDLQLMRCTITALPAAAVAFGLFGHATEGNYPGAQFALGATAGAMASVGIYLNSERRIRRSTETLDAQESLSKQLGERVEFFNSSKGQLRWYGSYDQSSQKPLTTRAAEIAQIAEEADIERVIVPSGIASILGLPGKSKEEARMIVGAWTPPDKDRRKYFVTSISPEEIKARLEQLEHEPDSGKLALHAALNHLGTAGRKTRLQHLLQTDLDELSVDDLQKISSEVNRQIEFTQLDTVMASRNRSPDDPRKSIKHAAYGLLSTDKKGYREPHVRWLAEGRFIEEESLWQATDTTFDQALETMTHAPKARDRYNAALLIAAAEIHRTNRRYAVQTDHEQYQEPYQANLAIYTDADNPHKIEAVPTLTARRLNRLTKIMCGLALMTIVSRPVIESRLDDSQAIETVNAPIEQTLASLVDMIPDLDVSESGATSTSSEVDDSRHAIGKFSDVSKQPNEAVWGLESRGMRSDGMWITAMSNQLNIDNGKASWMQNNDFYLYTFLADATEPAAYMPHVKVSGYVDMPKNYGPIGVLMDPDAINLPVLQNTGIVTAKVELAGKTYPAQINIRTDGTSYLDLSSTLGNVGDGGGQIRVEYSVSPFAVAMAKPRAIQGVKVTENGEPSYPLSADSSEQIFTDAGFNPATPENVFTTLKDKEYTLSALSGQKFSDLENLIDTIADSDEADCSVASAAQVLRMPEDRNMLFGYMNRNGNPNSEVLSLHEMHAAGVDAQGAIIDATPINTNPENDKFFEEDFTEEKTATSPDETYTEGLRKATLLGSISLLGGGALAAVARRRKRKELADIETRDMQAAYNLVNHALFAPTDAPLDTAEQTMSRQDILKSIQSYDLNPHTMERVTDLIKRSAQGNDVPNSALRAAQRLLQASS